MEFAVAPLSPAWLGFAVVAALIVAYEVVVSRVGDTTAPTDLPA